MLFSCTLHINHFAQFTVATTVWTFFMVTQHRELVHGPTLSLSAHLLEHSRQSVNATQIMTIVR